MDINFSHDPNSGRWQLSFKRHIFVSLGIFLITSGLATLSGPWWQGILVALLGKAGVLVDDKYQWVIATTQIIFGLGLLAYKYFIYDRRIAKISADRRVVEAARLDFNMVRNYLSDLENDHSYKSSFNSAFSHALTRFKVTEYKFQYSPIVKSYEDFVMTGTKLQCFVDLNFFTFPSDCPADGDYRYCLAPHLNMDRGMVIYDQVKVADYNRRAKKLHELVNQTKNKFEKLIHEMNNAGVL